MIAMRGAFISGGVEWNAGPQVHTVTILSPVDVVTGKNSDGSGLFRDTNFENTREIDWILYKGMVKMLKYEEVDYNVDGVYPSDHKPIYVEFEILQN